MVVQWDVRHPEEGELIARLPNSIYALHRLPNTQWLVVGHNYEGIHLIDFVEKKPVRSLQLTHSAIFDIQSVGPFLLVACGDGALVVVDREAWRVVARLSLSDKSARTIAVHPHGHEVAVGFSDFHVRILSVPEFRLRHAWEAHQNSVFTVSYSASGDRLLTTSRDARLKEWRGPNYEAGTTVVAHLFAINHLAWHPNQTHFATASMDKSIKLWDAHSMHLLKVIDKARHAGHGTSVNRLLWLPYRQWLVSASDDRTLSVWEIEW